MKLISSAFVFTVSLVLTWSSSLPAEEQATAGSGYVSADLNATIFRVDRATFNPAAMEIRAGYYLQRQVAVEALALAGITDDEDGALTGELNSLLGVNLRFETPERERGKIMILLGYSFLDIDLALNDSAFPGSETFDGFSFGLGSEYRLDKSGHWYIGAKLLRYLDKDDISFDTMGIGLRYVF